MKLFKLIDYNTSGAVVIPATYNGKPVTHVSNYAFSNRKGITSVTFPNSLIEIGRDAFNSCTGIKSITIPASVATITAYAFNTCTNLTSVTFQGGAATLAVSGNARVFLDDLELIRK